jgi:hypothetical protein
MSRGPGRWQRIILALLEDYEGFVPRAELQTENDPSHSQYTAVLRAAHALAKQGKCKIAYVWAENRNRRITPQVFVFRPDTDLETLEVDRADVRYERRRRGLPRTEADKRRAVEVLLSLPSWREKDPAVIAAHVGVSLSFVNAVKCRT